ncbi:hypothetical protein BHE90_007908 [Fusarium euwallaceae]|uniref:Uncharacterized protein n=1 Tax=Fusarium euwallaceae TaxID=1147111 RepID=A0A430LPG7_9HYPO|nr:hypothetical protein BHE90_007908 [Fusarium euwallaceae]
MIIGILDIHTALYHQQLPQQPGLFYICLDSPLQPPCQTVTILIRPSVGIMPTQEERVLQTLQSRDLDFSGLSVQAYRDFSFGDIDLDTQQRVCSEIVDEIFRQVDLVKHDAPACWSDAVHRLMKGKLLETTANTTLNGYNPGWKKIRCRSKKAMKLYKRVGKSPCIPAPDMIYVIAMLFHRGVGLDEASLQNSSPHFLELFGVHDTTKWLRVAILNCAETHDRSFLVEIDQEMVVPQVRHEGFGHNTFSIVTTAEPPTHQYRGLVNSRFRHTQIQLLLGPREPLPSGERSHRESTASTDDDDSPIEQVVTRSITRAQALERAGDLVNQVRNPHFDQYALKDRMGLWLSEPVIRVLPMGLKKQVLLYCSDHLPDWSVKIKEHYYEDRDEHTWQETIEVAPAEQAYGKETLGSLLAELKTVEPKIHPTELRDVVTGLRRRIRPHGKHWDKLLEDMVFVLKGSGTSTAEQRKTLAEEMSRQRQALEEERQAFAQERQTFAEEMSQRYQSLDRDLEVFARRRQALADTSDLETLWEWFLDAEVGVPHVLRIVMHTRCSWETLERLTELENAQN